MRRVVVVAVTLLSGVVAAACSSSNDGGGVPLGPGSGSSTSSSGSSGDTDPRAAKYCYRYHDKAMAKGVCVCGALFCAKKTSGECGCLIDQYRVDTAEIECTPGPLATPTNGQTESACCLGGPEAGGGLGLCRCGTTALCEGAKPTATCSRSELTTKQLVPGNVIFEDAKIRITAMSKDEVDQWLADGRATKQGANTLCNEP